LLSAVLRRSRPKVPATATGTLAAVIFVLAPWHNSYRKLPVCEAIEDPEAIITDLNVPVRRVMPDEPAQRSFDLDP
jgi:hypothetical protein